MNRILVYLGSDHVIQNPRFGLRETTLNVSVDQRAAVREACCRNAAGVVNSYYLNLDSLSVKAPAQKENYDVVLGTDTVSLCSEDALNALAFFGASFVCQ